MPQLFGRVLIDLFDCVVLAGAFAAAVLVFGGCASQVTAGPNCTVIAEVNTGTRIRCVEIERDSIDKSIRATGEALGGFFRGLVMPPGAPQ